MKRPLSHQRSALGELVGQAGRLRKAETPAETEDPLGGLLEADAMAHGDVQGGDSIAGTEDETDEVRAVAKIGA
jgi:hypothetical protein